MNITIYSKDYCPYCKAAKALLSSQGLSYVEIDVEHNTKKMAEMIKRTGRHTVPQVYFGTRHIGGHDDLLIHMRDTQGTAIA